MGNKVKDLTGKRFGKLVVQKFVGIEKRRAIFQCKCDCGNKKNIVGQLLSNGHTRSCGCLAVNNTDQTTHGLSKTPLYNVWCGIKYRCYNEKSQHYHNYGGRGIKMCDEWLHDFQAFYDWAIANGYKDGLTIDRIDVNGDYEPSNCRWVDMKTQNNNRGNNHLITYNGKTQTLAQWANEKHIKQSTLCMRLNKYHWSVDRALNTP